jgi:hypothetical protein
MRLVRSCFPLSCPCLCWEWWRLSCCCGGRHLTHCHEPLLLPLLQVLRHYFNITWAMVQLPGYTSTRVQHFSAEKYNIPMSNMATAKILCHELFGFCLVASAAVWIRFSAGYCTDVVRGPGQHLAPPRSSVATDVDTSAASMRTSGSGGSSPRTSTRTVGMGPSPSARRKRRSRRCGEGPICTPFPSISWSTAIADVKSTWLC